MQVIRADLRRQRGLITGVMLPAILLAGAMAVAAQTGSEDLVGQWEGQLGSGRPVQVTMTVAAPDDSGRVAPKLFYGAPRDCRIDFQAARVDPAQPSIYFGIDKVNGGYCLQFFDGYMMIAFDGATRMSVTVFSKSETLKETFTLQRQEK